MNKKAEGFTIGQVMVVIVAVVVIAVVVWGVSRFYSSTNDYANNIPGFNNSQQQKSDIEEVRYNILVNTIQYYDGTTWRDFQQDSVPLGTKTVSQSTLTSAFTKYYFSSDTRTKGFVAYRNTKNAVVTAQVASSEGGISGSIFTNAAYSRGSVILQIWNIGSDNRISQTYPGSYALDPVKGLIYLDGGSNGAATPFSSNEESSIYSGAAQWRDSVLSKPISFMYLTPAGSSLTGTFCPKYVDRQYLVVDMTNVAGDSC